MFNEDGLLVGAVTVYTQGLPLDSYPQLSRTIAQLPPAREFYLNSSQLLTRQDPDSAILYRTGEATTTHQYVLRKRHNQDDHLVLAIFMLDPYERLFDSRHQEFLSYLNQLSPASLQPPSNQETSLSPDPPFLGLQQFARGEVALFGSCGTKQPDIALEAYDQAIKWGLPDKAYTAEAKHRRGLALKSVAKLEEAKASMEQALALQPHSATILNSYGTVLMALNQISRAIQTFEQALALQPDYAHARFNLAEAYERINPKRAIQEYETFLILVEGNTKESTKALLAKQRMATLQKGMH